MAAVPPFTIRQQLVACGIDDVALFNGESAAQRIANSLFLNEYGQVLDMTAKDITDEFEAYSKRTVAQGRLIVAPTIPKNVQAFAEWVRHHIRMGMDPADTLFPNVQAENVDLLRQATTHKRFVDDQDTNTKVQKPKDFMATDIWSRWKPTFVDFLRIIPGRSGVPLAYIVRANVQPDPTPTGNFLADYVQNFPHDNAHYATDNRQVASYIRSFCINHVEASTIMDAVTDYMNDGRAIVAALDQRYLGSGIESIEVNQAEQDISTLYYNGESVYMNWNTFKQRLKWAYATLERIERRQVYSDEMKLRSLVKNKIKASFLKSTIETLQVQMGQIPMTLTFDRALEALQLAVYRAHPEAVQNAAITKSRRQTRETNQRGRGRGRGNGGRGHGGHGRGGRGGDRYPSTIGSKMYSQRNHVPNTKGGSRPEQLSNNQWIEYHPAVKYADNVIRLFPQTLRDKMRREREEWRRNNPRSQSQTSQVSAQQRIQELESQINDLRSQASQPMSPPPPVGQVSFDVQSRISQVSAGSRGPSVMGGRREQQYHRDSTPTPDGGLYDVHGRRISNVITRFVTRVRQVGVERVPVPDGAPSMTTADNETDNNADTCVMGKNFHLLSITGRIAEVSGYKGDEHGSDDVHIGTGITAYDHPDGYTMLLVVHEGLWYGDKMDHSLINPNQVRHNRIGYWDNPYDTSHDLCIEIDDVYTIPLPTKGTKVYFTTRVPTQAELESDSIPRFELTSLRQWEPSRVRLSELSVDDYGRGFGYDARLRLDISQISRNVTMDFIDPRSNDADLASIDPLLSGLYRMREISQVRYDPDTDDIPIRRSFVSNERHNKATSEALSENLCIGLYRAKKTLAATLQQGTRSALLPLERRYRADRRFGRRRLPHKFSTDTVYFPIKSIRGYTATQFYFHKCGFVACYHMTGSKNEHVGPTLPHFASEFGVPAQLVMDGAPVQIGRNTDFMKFIRKNEIDFHVSHPYRPNENPAEGGVREFKRYFYRLQQKYDVPMRLWCFLADYAVDVLRIIANGSRYASDRVPMEIITGITPEISELLDFHFYQWVWYRDNAGLGPRTLGRWLGISHRTGPAMTYWILPSSARIISCDSVQKVTQTELQTDEVKQKMRSYDTTLAPHMNPQNVAVHHQDAPRYAMVDLENEEQGFLDEFNRVINDPDLPHATDDENDSRNDTDETRTAPQHIGLSEWGLDGNMREEDNYIDMIVARRRDPELPAEKARVTKRARDDDGNPIGKSHPTNNPLLDTRVYEVEYEDGTTETVAANILAENILAQVDENGYMQLMFDEIIDHRKLPDAVKKEDGIRILPSGAQRKVRTTRGWEICVQWKGGETTWVALKDFKESYPVQLAMYAEQKGLLDEPAFAWWARHVLKKKRIILSKVKSKYWEKATKYGIKLPKTVEQARKYDKENGNTLWMDAIRKEMSAVRKMAMEEHEGDPKDLIGFNEITGHLVFDVKLSENFRRKARFCADGHKTAPPASLTYSSVVSRDSVRILLLIAALNGLELRAADIQNAFLTAPNREKCYMIAGDEFLEEKGKCFIVKRALYGLKSASASFREFLATQLESLGYKSSLADPDVWMKPAVKPDGSLYYSYILAYVDDLLAIDLDAEGVLRQVGQKFKFKNDDVSEPAMYLGAKLKKREIDGTKMWTVSPDDYVTAAVKNVEEQIKGTKWKLPGKVSSPMVAGYHPELDDSEELGDDDVTRFQELIGIVRWATEIGRVDSLYEVSVLSQYQAVPREGHMRAILRIFAFWKKRSRIAIYMDPRLPNFDFTNFVDARKDFQMHYRDAKEIMPDFMPKPRGMPVWITAYCDASHAANKVTRRSHTGFIVFVNRAPILWYSKRQATVESSTFSSEFIALRSCIESITHLRYKLRMFGIPLGTDFTTNEEDPARIFCDNETVVKNSSLVESTLNKKHSSIAYHFVRWNVAAGVTLLAWIRSEMNLADTYTKALVDKMREDLYEQWTY